MMKRILLPLDGSPVAQRAVPVAVHLASAIGAHLIVMHGRAARATVKQPDFDIEAFAMSLRECEAIGALTAPGRTLIDAVVHDVYGDSVAESICESAADPPADLIVMSTHGHGGSGHSI